MKQLVNLKGGNDDEFNVFSSKFLLESKKKIKGSAIKKYICTAPFFFFFTSRVSGCILVYRAEKNDFFFFKTLNQIVLALSLT